MKPDSAYSGSTAGNRFIPDSRCRSATVQSS
jgi:hypothetical protein